ncbi:MAG: FAD-dependent oxidoreductase [Candidatus Kapabacteria bacterium]|nr:FAD-dependent oxidoreductase [Candidatus Kapabacteria bacterium]
MYDYIILGAGYAGLSAAALLAKRGFKTLLLESHATLGGCASFFRRKNFTFDVGATTLSGLLPHQPLGRIFRELQISPALKRLDDAMVISMLNDSSQRVEFIRNADRESWMETVATQFGALGQRKLWEKLYDIERRVWEVTRAAHRLPPRSIGDVLSLTKPALIRHAAILPGMFRPFTSLLQQYGLHTNRAFRRFADEQLLISTQNTSDYAPVTSAAMGLCYPSETYYPYGGMYAPLHLMQKSYKQNGGEILYRYAVTRIRKNADGYRIHAAAATFDCKGIISSIPIWNMPELTDGAMQSYFGKKAEAFNESWAAFTLYFAVKQEFPLRSSYYQIHAEQTLPFCSSSSVFVSFSRDDDTAKAPAGYRTVTVSTHTLSDQWESLDAEEYQRRKGIVTEAILSLLRKAIPGFADTELLYLDAGTPQTFRHYTQRYRGYVGGIPHSIKRNLLLLPPNKTPFNNFYMIGDSVFPGQGTPAVALGALNVVDRISR